MRRGLIAFGAAALAAAGGAGCASGPLGLNVALGGSDCCWMRVVERSADEPAAIACRCLATDAGGAQVTHDGCAWNSGCVCWSLAGAGAVDEGSKSVLALLSR